MRRGSALAVSSALALGLAASSLGLAGAAMAQDAASDPLPETLGAALEPGRYVSSAVGPTIDFRVGEGWLVGPSGGGPIFTLERADPPGTVLSVTRFDGEVFFDSCDPTSMTLVEPTVERLIEVIAGNPFLNAGPPSPLVVDGFEAQQLDVGVPPYTECPRPFLLVWAVPIGSGGEFVQVANQQSRFVAIDVEGDVIVVAIESFPGVPFGGLLDASMELIASMRIEPGEYVPPPTPSPSPVPSPSPTLSPSPVPSPEPSPAAEPSPTALGDGS